MDYECSSMEHFTTLMYIMCKFPQFECVCDFSGVMEMCVLVCVCICLYGFIDSIPLLCDHLSIVVDVLASPHNLKGLFEG